MDECKVCHKLLEQIPGNHRKREYCGNTCKQTDFRKRKRLEDLERQQAHLRECWGGLLPETLTLLDTIMQSMSQEVAEQTAAAIVAEKQRPVSLLSWEEAEARARLHNYLNDGWYLESTQRLFIRLFQTGQIAPSEVREAINHERSSLQGQLVARDQATNDAEIEQRHRQLGQLLIECGKRLKYQELPLSILYKDLLPWLFEADLYDIKAGRSNWCTASSAFSSEGLIVAGIYAHYLERVEQILKQERDIAAERIWRNKLEVEDAQRDERESRSRYYQSKERLEEAEEELSRYRQLCDLSDQQRMVVQALALGAQLGYKPLIAVDPIVGAGEGAWSARVQQTDIEDLARIIASARHYAENLIWIDAQAELKQAKRRIRELEQEREQRQEAYSEALETIGTQERALLRYQRMKLLESRRSMEQELVLLGGRLNYTGLVNLGIQAGLDQWIAYMRAASDEELAAAIAHAYYQADSRDVAVVKERDNETASQMRKHIKLLESELASVRAAELGTGSLDTGEERKATRKELEARLHELEFEVTILHLYRPEGQETFNAQLKESDLRIRDLGYFQRENQLTIDRQARRIAELERQLAQSSLQAVSGGIT